jgi:hypothetical protein
MKHTNQYFVKTNHTLTDCINFFYMCCARERNKDEVAQRQLRFLSLLEVLYQVQKNALPGVISIVFLYVIYYQPVSLSSDCFKFDHSPTAAGQSRFSAKLTQNIVDVTYGHKRICSC